MSIAFLWQQENGIISCILVANNVRPRTKLVIIYKMEQQTQKNDSYYK